MLVQRDSNFANSSTFVVSVSAPPVECQIAYECKLQKSKEAGVEEEVLNGIVVKHYN